MYILRYENVAGKTEHFEQLDGLVIDIGENNTSAVFFGNVNYSEEDGDANAVDQLGVAEVNNQRTATPSELPATLTLDPFTG